MPNSSPHLHLLQFDGCDDSKPFLDLPRRVLVSAPNNEPHNRRMNTRKLLESIPERERDMERESDPECKIRARKGYDRCTGRPVMVFKRTGPARKKQACGMPNCPTCGVFWRMDIEDLEKRVPGLISEQVIPKQSVTLRLRESVCASPAPSVTGSTTSTLTEFTEISEISQELLGQSFDSGLPTPHSTHSSATCYTPSVSSTQSTPTKPPKNIGLYGPPSPSSSSALFDCNRDSTLFSSEHFSATPSLSTLTELTERSRRSDIFNSPAPSVVVSSSTISTLTDFTELDTSSTLSTPPSSLSSIPPTLSTATIITAPHSTYKTTKVRKHKSMVKMSDGTEWVPPTLERVQAYISSQGERRLAQSARLVVATHAERGSRVARRYEAAIRKVDHNAGIKPQTRAEVLGPGVEEDEKQGEEEQEVAENTT